MGQDKNGVEIRPGTRVTITGVFEGIRAGDGMILVRADGARRGEPGGTVALSPRFVVGPPAPPQTATVAGAPLPPVDAKPAPEVRPPVAKADGKDAGVPPAGKDEKKPAAK